MVIVLSANSVSAGPDDVLQGEEDGRGGVGEDLIAADAEMDARAVGVGVHGGRKSWKKKKYGQDEEGECEDKEENKGVYGAKSQELKNKKGEEGERLIPKLAS